jgi:hypothetical protein
VTGSCPYDTSTGSQVDMDESGDEIVTLNINSLPGDCIAGHFSPGGSEDNTELNVCTHSGTDWVLVPAPSGFRLANPAVTNDEGGGEGAFEVFGQGTGNPPTLDTGAGNVFETS